MHRLLLVVLLLLVPVRGAAQSAQAGDIPRTAWGRPSLQGVWTNSSLTPLERPDEYGEREFHTAEEVADLQRTAVRRRIDALPEPEASLAVEFSEVWMEAGPLSGRTSLITGPTGKVPPFTPEAQERLADGRAQPLSPHFDSHADRGFSERCLRFVTGGPPMMAFPFAPIVQIVETSDHVVIQTEENHEVRVIALDGRPRIDPRIRLWRGDARGHWEGDTLVVETVNFNGKGGFRGSAAAMHLTERLTRIDGDTILYEFTVDDPETWTAPWTAEMPLRATPGPLFEHACHEGNYTLPLVLNGARVQEREQAAP